MNEQIERQGHNVEPDPKPLPQQNPTPKKPIINPNPPKPNKKLLGD